MQDLTATPSMAPHPDDNVHPVSTTVLERFPAAHPRGSWPAEEYAAARRTEGINAIVTMDPATDTFLVKAVNA